MGKKKFIQFWHLISNKHIDYNKKEYVGEKEMLKHFTTKELIIAEKKEWITNNHAEYDQAEPSYCLTNGINS